MASTRHAVHLLRTFLIVAILGMGPSIRTMAQVPIRENDRLARDIFKELIEINTTDEDGSTTDAANAMARLLLDHGFPAADVRVLGPTPNKGNLIVRYRGSNPDHPAVLLLAHLDVVQALPTDWTVPPFEFLERDGYYYGRGTSDDKAMASIWIANLIRYKEEGFIPDRDIVVALTADEEGGNYNGVQWLLANHRDLIESAFVLNEGGGGAMQNGRRLLNAVQASEKVYQSFRLEVTNPGGHSSLPVKDNAIAHLARALTRITEFDFPVQLNEVTRTFFDRTAGIEAPNVAADMRAILQTPPDPAAVARLAERPRYNALMRTTCVATRIDGGHADNALPQRARAVVNCRILPGEPPGEVLATLIRIIDNDQVSVAPMNEANPSPPSPLDRSVMGPIEQITSEMWPGVPVIPTMSTGATDGLYLRQVGIAVYGVSGLFGNVDDVRAHGQDERIGVREYSDGLEFLYRLVKALTGPGGV